MKIPHRVLVICTVVLALSSSALNGQQAYEGIQQGFPPFGSFSATGFDSISLQNGNLHARIPILSVAQRGRTLNYELVFDTDVWETVWTPNPDPRQGGRGWWNVERSSAPSGWRLADPTLFAVHSDNVAKSCTGYGSYVLTTNYQFIEPDGTQHPLAVQKSPAPAACDVTQLTGPATDGSGVTIDLNPSGKLRLKDGTQTSPSLKDTNGNTWSSSADMLNRALVTVTNGPLVQYTSPGGRTTYGYQYTTWTVKDSSGNSQVYRMDFTAFDYSTAACGSPYSAGTCYEEGPFAVVRPIKLTLPNTKFYQFTWTGTFVDLTRIDLPTGGNFQYTYGTSYYRPSNSTSTSTSNTRRVVTSKTVNPGGSIWLYGIPGPTVHTGSVRDPLGNDEVHTFAYFVNGVYSSSTQYETQIQFYQGTTSTGTLLRTIAKNYLYENDPVTGLPDANVRVNRETTTLESGQASKIETDFETFTATFGITNFIATRLNPTERREYDYGTSGTGALVRKTGYSYLHSGNSTYLNLNIVDRLTSVITYDGSGNIKAQSQHEYDNYTAGIGASGAIQHDSGFGTSYTTRGNVTAIKSWRNTDGVWLITRNQYDDAGNILSTTDPLNHATQIDYADSWTTQTGGSACSPVGGPGKIYVTRVTNALNQVSSTQYFSCTGLAGSTTDPNSRTTTTSYDLFNRLVTVYFPDGGQTQNSYDDTALIVTTNRLQNTSGVRVYDRKHFDALGRLTQQELCEDGSASCASSIKTDYTYDSKSRVSTVSNPHRAASSATDGTTTYIYDALNRPCVVIPPDGTAVTGSSCPASQPSNDVFTVYVGNVTTVTDQAGKKRKSVTDALSRLVQVYEDPDSLNHETDYAYDVLDNLTCVAQKGTNTGTFSNCASTPASWRPRSFTYNSLSQLTQAVNPESGTINYSYDNAGNLSSKTGPKPNQTGTATVTTTYAYDVLNRVTQKSFNDGVTPATKYGYDGIALSGCTTAPPALTDNNPIRSRTSMCDGAGAESWSHDSMGRTLANSRTTNSITKNVGYTYNLDGSLNSLTYPSGRSITYAYDGAGRQTAATDIANNVHWALNAHYAPHGALSSLQDSDGVEPGQGSVFSNYFYNNRLQLCRIQIKAGTQPTSCTDLNNQPYTVLDLKYDYVDSSGHNNGNVASIYDGIYGFGLSQSFSYDSLNRLATAGTLSTGWGYSYGYDPWGNLLTQTLTQGSGTQLSVAVNTKNQIIGFTYDAAGNLLSDGSNGYTYDAENHLLTAVGATYAYDGDGNRVKKSTGNLYWYGGGSDALLFTDSAGNNPYEFIFFNGKRYAWRDPSGPWHFYHTDHLGNVRALTYGKVGATARYFYYPFGGIAQGSTSSTSPADFYKFTGKERDSESGLDNFGARFYGSGLGRFTSPDTPNEDQDTADPQSWNLYSYVRNNPLNNTDPTGNACVSTDGGATFHDDNRGGQSCKDAQEPVKVTVQDTAPPPTLPRLPLDFLTTLRCPNCPVAPPSREEIEHPLGAPIGPIGPVGSLGSGAAGAAQELTLMAKLSGILRAAARGKGNFAIGEATASEAAEAGEAWVGQGARVARDGKTLVSANGLKQYRPPSFKPNLGRVQANFESRPTPSGQWQSNGHLDIK